MRSVFVGSLAWATLAAAADKPPEETGPAPSPEEIERVLGHFRHEPSVREVQLAAINYYQVNPDKVRALRARARLKGMVPTLSGEVNNSLSREDGTLSSMFYRQNREQQDGPFEMTAKTGSELGWRVGASWNLDLLVFNAEELDVLSLIGIQDGVVREVTTVYYIRRRLQIELFLDPPKTLSERLSEEIRLQELTGLLDALTGGYMTRRLREAQVARR